MAHRVLRFFCFAAITLLCSCGAIQYTKQMEETEQAFTQAREQKAREYAPYEYYYAKAYLDQARVEAAHSSYENAIRYAKAAEKHCSKASEIASKRREEEGDTGAIR
jgi:tetratricopeptide (TPR) repeat protein